MWIRHHIMSSNEDKESIMLKTSVTVKGLKFDGKNFTVEEIIIKHSMTTKAMLVVVKLYTKVLRVVLPLVEKHLG